MKTAVRLGIVGSALACFLIAPIHIAVAVTTANEWKRFSDSGRRTYVIGVIDTWGTMKLLLRDTKIQPSVHDEIYLRLVDCVQSRGMPYSQVIAIVEKFIADRPADGHYSMPSLIFSALNEWCTP